MRQSLKGRESSSLSFSAKSNLELNMIFLLLIEDDIIHIIESEKHVANKYNYLSSKEDTPTFKGVV